MSPAPAIPRVLWTYWHDGWEKAPEVVRACQSSWARLNPGWQLNCLHRSSLEIYLDVSRLPEAAPLMPLEAFSDVVRIELLAEYGGVWADATVLCLQPLDLWLHDRMDSGFFAFERPAPDRLLSSWFLAAERGSYIAEMWRDRVEAYWRGRSERGSYFWFHELFAELCEDDDLFRRSWSAVEALPAVGPHHFEPGDARLLGPFDPSQALHLARPVAPVMKLTHKGISDAEPDSHLERLVAVGRGERTRAGRRLLVSWYGSFGHGTIGDLRAMETAVGHLVASGHEVLNASDHATEIEGSQRVDWRDVDAREVDAVIFVCGPILRSHVETTRLFDHFAGTPIVGLAVSLLADSDPDFSNPFDVVFAREGGPERFGDLAVLAAPRFADQSSGDDCITIGVALRGVQAEYGGEASCLWQKTERLVGAVVEAVSSAHPCRTVEIENHLVRSGLEFDEIDRQYGRCDLVITSRFHGAVMSLRALVPFIAIDQIRGGAKLSSLLGNLGWPHLYRADEVSAGRLGEAALGLLERPGRSQLLECRNQAVREANRTLTHLDAWLETLPRVADGAAGTLQRTSSGWRPFSRRRG